MNLPKDIEQYLSEHMTPESSLLHTINRETHLEVLMPRMLSGHLQGALLTAFSQMIRPKCILEIGTYTGYSAICMAKGLAENGKLITVDKNEELEHRVRGYFEKSTFNSQIEYKIGNAIDIVPSLNETFDLVFIDADKANYLTYYNQVFNKVSQGGFIIADNVLWSGKITQYEKAKDKDTVALREFNQAITHDKRVENFILPVRDGLMVAHKL